MIKLFLDDSMFKFCLNCNILSFYTLLKLIYGKMMTVSFQLINAIFAFIVDFM
ncbi:MAG: hypothetical protein AB2N28_0200 [Candidatus Phytoplasma solani]